MRGEFVDQVLNPQSENSFSGEKGVRKRTVISKELSEHRGPLSGALAVRPRHTLCRQSK